MKGWLCSKCKPKSVLRKKHPHIALQHVKDLRKLLLVRAQANTKTIFGYSVMGENKSEPVMGALATLTVAASVEDVSKIEIGPFAQDETPRIVVRPTGEDPPDALSWHVTRIAHGKTYKLLYAFQNYGVHPIKVTISRIPGKAQEILD